jgi:hypothetical protein
VSDAQKRLFARTEGAVKVRSKIRAKAGPADWRLATRPAARYAG